MLASRALMNRSCFRDSMMSFLYSTGNTFASTLAGSLEQAPKRRVSIENPAQCLTTCRTLPRPRAAPEPCIFLCSTHALGHAPALRRLRWRSGYCTDTPECFDGGAVPRLPRTADSPPQRFVNGLACEPKTTVERL